MEEATLDIGQALQDEELARDALGRKNDKSWRPGDLMAAEGSVFVPGSFGPRR